MGSTTSEMGNGSNEEDAKKTNDMLSELLRAHEDSMVALLDEFNLQIEDWRNANQKQLLLLKRESATNKRKNVAADGANKRLKV